MRSAYMIAMAVVIVLALAVPAFAGNGAPSGTHYNLNILGKENCPGDDLKGTGRHTIFVRLRHGDATPTSWTDTTTLDKRNKIFLAEGDFQVADGNACDGDGAQFYLPANPYTCPVEDPDCLDPKSFSEFQNYHVYARALAKPGGSATVTTCATAVIDNVVEYVCSSDNVTVFRKKGKSSFVNVTQELTTILADVDENGTLERVPLFAEGFNGFFWDYDNSGLRLLQLRFYPVTG